MVVMGARRVADSAWWRGCCYDDVATARLFGNLWRREAKHIRDRGQRRGARSAEAPRVCRRLRLAKSASKCRTRGPATQRTPTAQKILSTESYDVRG